MCSHHVIIIWIKQNTFIFFNISESVVMSLNREWWSDNQEEIMKINTSPDSLKWHNAYIL